MNNVSILFNPLKLGDVTIPNRIIMAAMTRMRSSNEDKIPNDLMREYYTQRASAGLILTECTLISSRSNAFPGAPGIYTDQQVEGWKKIVQSVHQKNGRIFLQIWHAGRATDSKLQNGQEIWAPSPIPIQGPMQMTGSDSYETPHEMTINEIKEVISQFKEGAWRAKKAGFDGIELHGANGYIVDQFLKSNTNKRSDQYGGSIENRCRFCLEIMDQLIQVFGRGRVGIKVSPIGRYNDMFDEDPIKLYSYLFKELEKRQIAFIEIMNDDNQDNYCNYGHIGSRKQVPDLLKQLRPQYKGIIIGNVKYTPQLAAQQIEQGIVDAVSFATLYISNPDLVERVRDNQKLASSDYATYFGGDSKGYTDYPPYK